MEGHSGNSDSGLKAYSLEIAIILAAILISSTIFVAVGQLGGRLGTTVTGTVNTAGVPAQQNPRATASPVQVSLENRAIRGDVNAPVTIVEFSDFQCPFCKRASPTVEQILNDYQGRVRLVYKHYPLDFHQNAFISAEAYECAFAQGKGWEYHDKLFDVGEADGTNLAEADLKRYAQELGLDTARFNSCLDNHEKRAEVQKDIDELNAKTPEILAWGLDGIGTPLFLINGEPLAGAQPYSAFKAKLDAILAR